ncbi:tyrosine-protein phosphatase [Bacteroides sp. 519]|uniref:tyrosine-protein phosphatase n=1 Tax=Bacteroides sp. 519 TaxID=2302937 RepID=UPI0013D0198C|nr:tyrosine-protein phosphatase [Bacteroides sp. 519]NDV56968.1 tyrosine-protein phosphatase [Bacteroides sp. 519]
MKQNLILLLFMSIVSGACNNSPKAVYEGDDISGFAEITRDKQTKAAKITISKAEEWKLYAGLSVDEIDLSAPVLWGNEKGTFHIDAPDSVRSYFLLQTNKGKAIVAERHLPMTGGYNFRDLGGIKNKEGRYTKWGKIFRSDDLNMLTDADLQYLSSIPIVSIVDFRSEAEMQSAPDKLPASTIKSYPYSINPGNLSTAAGELSDLLHMNMDTVMMQINAMMITEDAGILRFKDFFALLQDERNVPLMFHCSAGKDRTGMAAALVLSALGVSEERIMEDYLLSNQYIVDKYAKYVERHPQLKSLFQVKAEFIGAGLQRIKEEYGSIEDFLTNVLNVDIDKFRDMYLY